MRDGAEFITYYSNPISRLLANTSPNETALVTAAYHMPNPFHMELVWDQRPEATNALGFFQRTPKTSKELR